MNNFNNLNKELFDKDIRSKLLNNPKEYFRSLMSDIDVKVVESTKSSYYFVIPWYDKNIKNEDLINLSAAAELGSAGSIATVGSLGSAGTIGTAVSTTSSVSTASSVGSLGSASTAK